MEAAGGWSSDTICEDSDLGLTIQKREFAFGWLSWFGAEIVAVAAALLNLIWVPFVVFQVVAIPDSLLLLPSVAAFVVSLLHFVSAYRTRVAVPYRQMLGAMVVFMSVQWTVARAAFEAALPAQKSYFHRTRKGGGGAVHGRFAAIPEAVLGTLLVAGGITVFVTNTYRLLDTDLFGGILIIQSLPFLSAVAVAALERFSEAANTKAALPS